MKKKEQKVKKLYRNKKDAILGGVCSGLADYFDLDPTIMRLLWTAFTVLSAGAGIIIYIIAWIIVPPKNRFNQP